MSSSTIAPPESAAAARDLLDAAEKTPTSSSVPVASRPRPRYGRNFIFVLLILAGLAWSVRYAHRLFTEAETDNAYLTGHLHQVSPRIAGTVNEVLVEENTEVAEGTPLVRLDPRDGDTKVLQAKALLALADAKLTQAEADLASNRAKVAQSSAQLEKAQLDFRRAKELSETKVASKQEYDTAKASLDSAKAGEDSARAAASASESALVAARAQRKAGEVYLEDAELQRSYTVITAPVAGRVGKRNVEVGNHLQAGQPVFAIVEPNVWIVANFKETQLARMRVGQRADVTVDALPGTHFTGTVESFSPASGNSFALLPADNATGNFTKVVQRLPVRIRFNADSIKGSEDRLRAGLSAVVAVHLTAE